MRAHRRASPDPAATWLVESVAAVQSADLVFQPSAGGSFDRVLESQEEREPPMDLPEIDPAFDATAASPRPLEAASRPEARVGVVQGQGDTAPTSLPHATPSLTTSALPPGSSLNPSPSSQPPS